MTRVGVSLAVALCACSAGEGVSSGPAPESGGDELHVRLPGQEGEALAGEERVLSADCEAEPPLEIADTGAEVTSQPRMTASTAGYGIVYSHGVEHPFAAIDFARVELDGSLGVDPRAVLDQPTAQRDDPAGIAAVGDGYGLVWTDKSSPDSESPATNLRFQRLDTAGSPSGDRAVTDSDVARNVYAARPAYVDLGRPQLAEQLSAVWMDRPVNGQRSLFVVGHLDATGGSELVELSGLSASSPSAPMLAVGDALLALGWKESGLDGDASLHAAILDREGRVIAQHSLGAHYGVAGSPDLARGAGEFAAVFAVGNSESDTRIKFVRFSDTGQMLLEEEVTPGGRVCQPAIARSGKYYAVVWRDDCRLSEATQLKWALLSPQGRRLAKDGSECRPSQPTCGVIDISAGAQAQAARMIGTSTGAFGLTWLEQEPPAGSTRVMFSRVVCRVQAKAGDSLTH